MKTKIIFLLFLLLVGVENFFAQSTNRDSLLQEIKQIQKDPSPLLCFLAIAAALAGISEELYSGDRPIGIWGLWTLIVVTVIIFSFYLGSICTIISFIYIFKDEIREGIQNFLRKRKERRNRKRQEKKQK